MKKALSQGFTLAELLIVLMIAGVLSIGALHGWQRWQQRQQLRETALQMQSFLLRLRAHANWHNRDYPIWHLPGERWCLGGGERPPQSCQPDKRLMLPAPHPDVKIYAINGEPGFYGRRNVARAGSIEFGNGAGRWRLIISARARIRLCQTSQEGCE
ncbi:prepilin peptidase-dependent protein [Pantoea sp.]|uniref:prepilin peptidase-dependent protein n=1 Tax=Pantoea sp. TaxID=69393 RepID=UPI0028A01B81|nr:prepilin peptidase-dependent protein [Pantoea sp.]